MGFLTKSSTNYALSPDAAAFENFTQHYGGAVTALASDEISEPFVRLVRPDAYLALEASLHGDDPTPVLERLARVLGTHVRRVKAMS